MLVDPLTGVPSGVLSTVTPEKCHNDHSILPCNKLTGKQPCITMKCIVVLSNKKILQSKAHAIIYVC